MGHWTSKGAQDRRWETPWKGGRETGDGLKAKRTKTTFAWGLAAAAVIARLFFMGCTIRSSLKNYTVLSFLIWCKRSTFGSPKLVSQCKYPSLQPYFNPNVGRDGGKEESRAPPLLSVLPLLSLFSLLLLPFLGRWVSMDLHSFPHQRFLGTESPQIPRSCQNFFLFSILSQSMLNKISFNICVPSLTTNSMWADIMSW